MGSFFGGKRMAIIQDVAPKEVRFGLTKPCADCPFLVSSAMHQGIANSLVEYHGYMELGTFAHTCHKTDPRSDGWNGKTKQARHCAGALAMQLQGKMELQKAVAPHIQVMPKKEMKALICVEGLWPSFIEMVRSYARWLKSGIPDDTSGSKYLGKYFR